MSFYFNQFKMTKLLNMNYCIALIGILSIIDGRLTLLGFHLGYYIGEANKAIAIMINNYGLEAFFFYREVYIIILVAVALLILNYAPRAINGYTGYFNLLVALYGYINIYHVINFFR